MKKKILALISVVVCLAALFAFSACSINIDLNNLDGEEKSELTADNKVFIRWPNYERLCSLHNLGWYRFLTR